MKLGNTTFIDMDFILPAVPFYISISNSKDQIQVSELRYKDSGPFMSYQYAKGDAKLKYTEGQTAENPKVRYFRIDHEGAVYAHYSCCELNCRRQVFHRISGNLASFLHI